MHLAAGSEHAGFAEGQRGATGGALRLAVPENTAGQQKNSVLFGFRSSTGLLGRREPVRRAPRAPAALCIVVLKLTRLGDTRLFLYGTLHNGKRFPLRHPDAGRDGAGRAEKLGCAEGQNYGQRVLKKEAFLSTMPFAVPRGGGL